MASVNFFRLHSGQVSNNTNGASISLEGLQIDFSGLLKVSQLGGNSAVTIKIQTSPENITWTDWIIFGQVTSPQSQIVYAPNFPLTYARAVFQFAPIGGPKTCTATIDLYYDRQRY